MVKKVKGDRMATLLKEIFGDTKRIGILEELVENWGEFLTIEEIARMADTSPKTAYHHINELLKTGILEHIGVKPKQFKLKEDDKRAVTLAILESAEYLRKSKELGDEKPVAQKPFFEVYTTHPEDLKAPNTIRYSNMGAEAK